MINMGELFAYDRIADPPMELVPMTPDEIEKYRVIEGDLLFARQSLVLEGAGKCSIILKVPQTTTFESHLIRVRLDESKVDPTFYYYFFRSSEGKSRVQSIVMQVAAAGIRGADLAKLSVPLPPLEHQRKIAAILSAYDDLIDNNNRRIAILEEMVQLLYREWFVHFRFPGHESVPMVESELGLIPEGWTWSTLGNVASEVRRTVQPSDIAGETPYIGLAHMPRRSITLSEWGRADEVSSTKLQFKTGEILFGKIRPYFHKVGVAPVDGVCSSDIIVVRPSEERWMALTLCCVSSDAFVEHASQTSQGTKMPRADWNLLVRYPLAVPPESQLGWFNETVGAVVDLLLNFIAKNIVLRTSRDILLPNILSGEWDIDNINLA